jgi:argininosuccinate lyase
MDYQETKRPFMEALDLVQESLDVCALVVSNLGVNKERLLAACTYELFAADRAYELTASAGLPFRDAYRIVAAEVTAQLERKQALPVESEEQLVKRLEARSHVGGAGNLGLDGLQASLHEVSKAWQIKEEHFTAAIGALVGKAAPAQEGTI